MYKTCCYIIGVKPGADLETIKKAYRQKAKLMHPDVNTGPGAHREFLELSKAYEYLVQFHQLIDDIKAVAAAENKTYKDVKSRKYYTFRKAENDFFRNKINLLDTLVGRIIFIFFHLVFLLIGIYMIVDPLLNLHKFEISAGFAIVSPLFTAFFSVIFGGIIIAVFVFSAFRLFIHSARSC